VRVWALEDGTVWDEIDCTDSGVVTHVTWLPRTGGKEPLLVTANYNVKQDLSRLLVRAVLLRRVQCAAERMLSRRCGTSK